MKIQFLSMIMVLSGCGVAKSATTDSVRKTELGWVIYEGGEWRDVSVETPKYVVHIVTAATDSRQTEYKSFSAKPVTRLEENGGRLCSEALGDASTQWSVNGHTGVLVQHPDDPDKTVIVTTDHAGDQPFHAIKSHDLEHAQRWLAAENEAIEVPNEFVLQIQHTHKYPKFWIIEVEGNHPGAALLEGNLDPETEAYAIIHPFGLPMKTTQTSTPYCKKDDCWINVDLAVGGSGGPLFTPTGELAGILVGTNVDAMDWSLAAHDHPGRVFHPCSCSQSGCPGSLRDCPGQQFIPASVIRQQLKGMPQRP